LENRAADRAYTDHHTFTGGSHYEIAKSSELARWLSAPPKGRVFQPLRSPPIRQVSRHDLKIFSFKKSRMGRIAIVTAGPERRL
jgi:hypothetical protein